MAQTKIKFLMEKGDDGSLLLKNSREYTDFDRQCPKGLYEMEIRPHRFIKDKTGQQLKAHFGLMIANAIEQANDMGLDTSSFLKEMVKSDLPSGIGLTVDFLKEIFYALCPMYRAGKRITLSKATTIEASKHFEDCCKLLAAHGIYVPEPDKNWKKK
jgi:hypothetical protein